jgi:hypothetical protein
MLSRATQDDTRAGHSSLNRAARAVAVIGMTDEFEASGKCDRPTTYPVTAFSEITY